MPIQRIAAMSGWACLFGVLVTGLWLALRFVLAKGKGVPFSLAGKIPQVFFVFYAACMVQITLLRGWDFSFSQGTRIIQLVPLAYTFQELERGLWAFVYPVFGNLFAFLPLGVLFPLCFPQRGRIFAVCFASLLFSLSIEVLQWVLGSGVSDVDDVIFNVLGGLAGFLLLRLVRVCRESLRRGREGKGI